MGWRCSCVDTMPITNPVPASPASAKVDSDASARFARITARQHAQSDMTRYNIDLVSKLCTCAVNSTRDCIQILLAFLNQFQTNSCVDGTTVSSWAPNSTCPRWLGMPRRTVYARQSMGGATPTRYQDIDERANQSDVPTSKREKCCTGTSIAAASLQLPWS